MPSLYCPPADITDMYFTPYMLALKRKDTHKEAGCSPVLTDVDVVDLVSHNGKFGDGLNHIVTLQHQVSLQTTCWGERSGVVNHCFLCCHDDRG